MAVFIAISLIILILLVSIILKALFIVYRKLRKTQYVCIQTRINTTYLFLRYLETRLYELIDREDYENAEIVRTIIKQETQSHLVFLNEVLVNINYSGHKKRE